MQGELVENADRTRMYEVLERLWAAHGEEAFDEADEILGVLIQTILSQSTTNANSHRAFAELVDRFEGDWNAVADAEVAEVVDAIKIGGLAKQKAPRIQSIIDASRGEGGVPDLEHLRELPVEEARKTLLGMKGVGPKTAAFVLMYAAGHDVFPMDTHILRIFRRLEFLSGNESDGRAHSLMEALIPEGRAYAAHMVLVKHGREVCHARTPECGACTLVDMCAAAKAV